jgi:hypothetical protein
VKASCAELRAEELRDYLRRMPVATCTSLTVFRRQERSIPIDSKWFKKSSNPTISPNIFRTRVEDLSSGIFFNSGKMPAVPGVHMDWSRFGYLFSTITRRMALI